LFNNDPLFLDPNIEYEEENQGQFTGRSINKKLSISNLVSSDIINRISEMTGETQENPTIVQSKDIN